jgi:hypothetical protein
MKGLKISNLSYVFAEVMVYFAEAIGRIFSPDDNSYPTIGVQPFEGDVYTEAVENF